MRDATDLGKMIRGIMAENNLSQGKFAKELGVSSGTLSNYITGKNIPGMDFLEKCVKRFNLKNEATARLFYSAFLSAAVSNNQIILDTQLIKADRIGTLAKALTVFMFYPMENYYETAIPPFSNLASKIDEFYNRLEKVRASFL